jgi:subtilisin family serine protease
MLVGLIDTGVNPWHSHMQGPGSVTGLRLAVNSSGRIREEPDFRDPVGHGTAVAGVLRQALPEADLFVVAVFDENLRSYPSLVARAILRAAAEGCDVINLSLSMPPSAGSELLAEACAEVLRAGCTLVASADAGKPGSLPAALPGVVNAIADDALLQDEVKELAPSRYAALGRPRDLSGFTPDANLWGHSFACARVSAYMAEHLAESEAAGSGELRGCPPRSEH